jgi:CRP-like cAMP-binding protein
VCANAPTIYWERPLLRAGLPLALALQQMPVRTVAAVNPLGNQLLAALPATERRRLVARSETVPLEFGDVLCETGDRLRDVYFPIEGFISLLTSVDKDSKLEVGLIGSEGMLGVSLLLGVAVSPLKALVQGAGSALRVDATDFSREVKRSPMLAKILNKYLYVLMSQLAHMAACSRYHLVEARLARWLLMTRDRAHSNDFRLTQEFLAYMLGVRRAGITHAASTLQKRNLIHYTRGRMTILDGRGLEETACDCYADAELMYRQLMN